MKNFEQFLNQKLQNVKENKLVSDYLSGNISDSEFRTKFNKEISLNEGVLSDVKGKVLDWFLGIIKSIVNSNVANIVKNGGRKVFNVLRGAYNYIKGFKEKHPIIFKCVVIFLIILLIFIATAASAYSQEPEASKLVINTAIGFIDSIHSDPTNIKYTDFDLMEAKAYLIQLREGELAKSTFHYSETAIKLANTAIDLMKNSIAEYKITHSDSLAVSLVNWFETGSRMIILRLEEIGTAGRLSTNITLGMTP
jgi:hypothetical protein